MHRNDRLAELYVRHLRWHGSEFGLEGPAGSAAIEKVFETYFERRGESYVGSEISFRSDYAEFFVEGTKTEEEALKR